MAVVLNSVFTQTTAGAGWGVAWEGYDWRIGLLVDGAPAPDLDNTLDDIDDYEATYKGYSRQEVTVSVIYDGGLGKEIATWTTAEFPYDSGETGDASNDIVGWFLTMDAGGGEQLMAEGTTPVTWTVDSDGHEPKIPLKVYMFQGCECP